LIYNFINEDKHSVKTLISAS